MTSAMSRGLLFGTAAESYERFRLGYPDEVVDRTLDYAGRVASRRPSRWAPAPARPPGPSPAGACSVLALEPDPEMFAVLERETRGMPVEPVRRDLESYDGPRTDLLYAAMSWHWVDPDRRCEVAAGLLTDGGTLAVFGGPMQLADASVQSDVAAAVGGDVDDPAFRPPDPDRGTGRSWLDDEIRGRAGSPTSAPLDPGRRRAAAARVRRLPLDALGLPRAGPGERQEMLRRIAEVLPPQVSVDLGVGLHLARRA